MEFYQTKRSQFNDIPEFAAKQLPLHPTARYSNFPTTWKNTRNQQYVPRPKQLKSDDSLFPCCLACVQTKIKDFTEPLWLRKANSSWLLAEWFWDFGFTLPEELVSLGVGVTAPGVPIERDRVFVFDDSLNRQYLDVSLQEHALLGGGQHEARILISSQPHFNQVAFEGQIAGSQSGSICIAIPRSQILQDGKEVWKRFIFKFIEMPYDLSNLLYNDDNVKVQNAKVYLNGVQL